MERKSYPFNTTNTLDYIVMLRRLGTWNAPKISKEPNHPGYNLSSFDLGERVRVTEGPNKGIEGMVVVERNGNYKDAYSSHGPESIAILTLKEEYDFSMEKEIALHHLKSLGILRQEAVENINKYPEADKVLKLEIVWVESPGELAPVESGQNSH